jgi:hypothetical protein
LSPKNYGGISQTSTANSTKKRVQGEDYLVEKEEEWGMKMGE